MRNSAYDSVSFFMFLFGLVVCLLLLFPGRESKKSCCHRFEDGILGFVINFYSSSSSVVVVVVVVIIVIITIITYSIGVPIVRAHPAIVPFQGCFPKTSLFFGVSPSLSIHPTRWPPFQQRVWQPFLAHLQEVAFARL